MQSAQKALHSYMFIKVKTPDTKISKVANGKNKGTLSMAPHHYNPLPAQLPSDSMPRNRCLCPSKAGLVAV